MDVCERALSDDASLSDDLQPPGLSLVGEPSYLLTDIKIWTRRLKTKEKGKAWWLSKQRYDVH